MKIKEPELTLLLAQRDFLQGVEAAGEPACYYDCQQALYAMQETESGKTREDDRHGFNYEHRRGY